MCGGCQALENACLSEEQGAGADGHEGSFFAGIRGLKLSKGFDQFERFCILLENVVDAIAAGNNQDVIFIQVLMSSLDVDVGFDGEARGGGDALGDGCKSALECFAVYIGLLSIDG